MVNKIKSFSRGRKCKYFGCTHILSIYNAEGYCHTHSGTPPKEKRLHISRGRLGKKKK